MSQEALGEALGVKQAKISKWERGQQPEHLFATLDAIERATGRPHGWILVASGAVDLDAMSAHPSLSGRQRDLLDALLARS